MTFSKTLNFSFVSLAALLCFSFGFATDASARGTSVRSSGTSALGNLETPILSLGALTAFSDDLKVGTSTPLGDLIDENDCQRKIVMPEEQPPLTAGDMQVPKFSIDISGPGCPVTYSAELSGLQHATGFTAQFKFKYVAQSAEAKALYDIDRAEFQGDLKAVMIELPNGGGLDFSFNYTGDGNSQSQGPFNSLNRMNGKVEFTMGAARRGPRSGAPSPFDLKIEGGFDDLLKFDFKNESAELKSSTTLSGLSPTSSFTINGIAVSEEDYKKIRDLVKLPGAGDVGLDTDEESTLECKAQVVSAGMTFPMATSRSCGGMKNDQIEVDGVKVIFDFIADPNSTSIRVDVCPAGGTCQTVERAFLSDETMSYVDEVFSLYSVVTSCEVVPACVP